MSAYETIRSVTRRSTFLVLAGAAGLLGFHYDNRLLLALFEASVAFFILSWLYVSFASKRIAVRRELPPRAGEGDALEVTLRVEAAGLLPGCLVEIGDWFPADPLPEKSVLVSEFPRGASAARVRYRATCARGRGRFSVGPLKVTVSDPLGFFRRTRPLGSLDEIVVFPRPFPIPDLGLRILQPGGQAEAATFRRAGCTPLFWGTREYQPGDNPRSIHWRGSARWGELILKQFEAPSQVEVTCILDLDRSTLFGVGRGSNVEHAVRIAASVGNHAIRHGHPFQLVAQGDDTVLLRPLPGPHRLATCLDTLACVRPNGSLPYGALLRRAAPLVAEGSAVVLLFNTLDFDADAFRAVAAAWNRRRVAGLAVLIDERTFLPREEVRQAPDPARVEKARALVREFGFSAFAVNGGDDLAAVFSKGAA
jgi:uncharacterized protein (DUF58 family)